MYDVIIIGGGPAGLTAGIYAARARLKTVLIEQALCGGQILTTDVIENFPGFPAGSKGPELAEWMTKQAVHFGLETITGEVAGITLAGAPAQPFTVTMREGSPHQAHAVVVATGARWNTLGIPGEAEFASRGVSYCATCDGPLFRGKDVVVIGGGDTAIEDALFLTRFAKSVTVIHRRAQLRATKILQERAFANEKIRFCLNAVATEIRGTKTVSEVIVQNVATRTSQTIPTSGVFVLIGMSPNTTFIKDVVRCDAQGYVITDDQMRTSVEGIFACGDVRQKLLRQVVTATGDGATAAFSAQHYIDRIKGTEYK